MTPHGRHTADHLVLSVGARTVSLLGGLTLPLEVERQVVFWFKPDRAHATYDADVFPIWAYEYIPGAITYGFPRLPRGVKASVMHGGSIVKDADSVNRVVSDDEVGVLRDALTKVLPDLSTADVIESDICLFTDTPDHDFVIDFHPQHSRVLVSSACSGHGFKFASVVGEIQADLVTKGRSDFDLAPFRIDRFS